MFFFFFKQKTAYEIVSRDWSSDVCSSDLEDESEVKFIPKTIKSAPDGLPTVIPEQILLLPRRMVVQGVKPEKDLIAAETAKPKEDNYLNLENHQKRSQWLRVTVITNF